MKTQDAINEFLHSRVAGNLSPVTIAWYRDKLQRFARSCPELPEVPGPIETLLASVKGTPETKHAHFRAFRAFFRFVSDRHETSNPMVKVRAPRCPRKVMATLEPNELMMLLYSATTPREKAILWLLVDTGMRSGEVVSLRKQDIKAESVMVRGKGGEREVPISDETRRLLLALIARDGKDERVFQGHKGPLTRHAVYRIVSAHMKKAGIQGAKRGGHRIRHAFGKGFLVNGGDTRSLQQIMGHKHITTTEKYATLSMRDVVEKHHKFSPLRSAYAASQESLWKYEAVKEAQDIITKTRAPEK